MVSTPDSIHKYFSVLNAFDTEALNKLLDNVKGGRIPPNSFLKPQSWVKIQNLPIYASVYQNGGKTYISSLYKVPNPDQEPDLLGISDSSKYGGTSQDKYKYIKKVKYNPKKKTQ